MDRISVESLPNLDINMEFDAGEGGNQSVIHPIFIPILYMTVLLGA